MRQLTLAAMFIAGVLASSAGAEVRDWEYYGLKNEGTISEQYLAQTSIDDDSLSLVYFMEDQAFYLWFEYRGETAFSEKLVDESEFFMRTRVEPELSGRYDSDYVFSGQTVTQPDINTAMPQIVVIRLSPNDIEALRAYEENNIIGVGYFLSTGYWRTYSFPSNGVWNAYLRIKDEVERRK